MTDARHDSAHAIDDLIGRIRTSGRAGAARALCQIQGLKGGARAYFIRRFLVKFPSPALIVCPTGKQAEALLEDLRGQGLLAGVVDGGLALRGDVLIQHGDMIVFAKPLVRRLWLTSSALDDALKIVRHVHATARPNASAAA